MVIFESLPEEKQLIVLNAGFSCFGKNGYKKTSISDIAFAAGISKASIFQYFGSKKDLYLYLFEYACEKIITEIPKGTDDFFECLQLGTDVKMRVMAQHPGMYDFLSSIVIETGEIILTELNLHMDKRISSALGGLFANVNWDKLKPGVDREMLFNAVRWINEGYVRSEIGKKDAETMRQELFGYLNFIRKTYYKEEYQQCM